MRLLNDKKRRYKIEHLLVDGMSEAHGGYVRLWRGHKKLDLLKEKTSVIVVANECHLKGPELGFRLPQKRTYGNRKLHRENRLPHLFIC